MEHRHKHLLISWKKLTSDDYLDEDTERIAAFKAQIHDLKMQIRQQQQQQEIQLQVVPRKLTSPQISSVCVQPRIGPCVHTTEGPFVEIHSSELDTDTVYDEIVRGEDKVNSEAEWVKNRRKARQFEVVKECLRVRLAHALPLPEALRTLSPQGIPIESQTTNQQTVSSQSGDPAVDPFVLSVAETRSESGSSSHHVRPVLLTDSDYQSTD